ncbi:hypothetical protein SDC9_144022 [bioreactor metagenome]|uniref:Uncharacterized protein n=1 Tax=bioreactor metagenome TaxID=1076179 RepID=A0A645E534_9ZZZZ
MLHDDAAAVFGCVPEGVPDFTDAAQVQMNALALVAVKGFDDHRQTNLTGRHLGGQLGVDHLSIGNGNLMLAEQVLGELLVAGNVRRDAGGSVGKGSLRQAAVASVAQSDEAPVSNAGYGNAPALGLVHNGLGAGSQLRLSGYTLEITEMPAD